MTSEEIMQLYDSFSVRSDTQSKDVVRLCYHALRLKVLLRLWLEGADETEDGVEIFEATQDILDGG